MRRFVTSGPGVSLLIVIGIFAVLVICYLKLSSESRFAVTLRPPEGFTIKSINRQAHRGSGSFAGYLPEGPNTFIFERAGVRYAYVVEIVGGFDAYLVLKESDLRPIAVFEGT